MLRAFFLIFALVTIAWLASSASAQKSGKPEIEIFPTWCDNRSTGAVRVEFLS